MKTLAALWATGAILTVGAAQGVGDTSADGAIVCPAEASAMVKLAAQEVRRYVYLRSGTLLPLTAMPRAVASIVLQTDAQFPSIGSQSKGIVVNPDTSVDVYFGPTAPAGHEANWVQTVPGKGWNVILRLYGPLQPWFDKSWKPGEIELVR